MKRKNYPPRLDTPENRDLAFNYALKYLSFRNRSMKEISDYLAKKNFIEETTNTALKRLLDLKFLNDEEFARSWIESRQKYKGKSKIVLRQELRIKGINNETINQLLNEADDDLEIAKMAFEKKKKTLSRLAPVEFRKKMAGFLGRKGFSWNVISKLLKD